MLIAKGYFIPRREGNNENVVGYMEMFFAGLGGWL